MGKSTDKEKARWRLFQFGDPKRAIEPLPANTARYFHLSPRHPHNAQRGFAIGLKESKHYEARELRARAKKFGGHQAYFRPQMPRGMMFRLPPTD